MNGRLIETRSGESSRDPIRDRRDRRCPKTTPDLFSYAFVTTLVSDRVVFTNSRQLRIISPTILIIYSLDPVSFLLTDQTPVRHSILSLEGQHRSSASTPHTVTTSTPSHRKRSTRPDPGTGRSGSDTTSPSISWTSSGQKNFLTRTGSPLGESTGTS